MRKTPPSSQPGKLQKRWGLPHIRLGYELARTLGSREAQMIVQQAISKHNEPYRVFRRLQLLRGWSHDEASSPIFP